LGYSNLREQLKDKRRKEKKREERRREKKRGEGKKNTNLKQKWKFEKLDVRRIFKATGRATYSH